jgi:hypothetical protein
MGVEMHKLYIPAWSAVMAVSFFEEERGERASALCPLPQRMVESGLNPTLGSPQVPGTFHLKEMRALFFDEEECPSCIVVVYLLLSAGERERTNHDTGSQYRVCSPGE